MPSIPLHCTPSTPHKTPSQNPLPQLLHTPSGLALLEIQGTINMPAPPVPAEAEAEVEAEADAMDLDQQHHHETSTPIGRLVFPDIQTDDDKKDSTKARRVYLYVGKHQRLTGTLKKLPKPLGVIRRRDPQARGKETGGDWAEEELEVVDIVEWKLLFSSRPEPVSE